MCLTHGVVHHHFYTSKLVEGLVERAEWSILLHASEFTIRRGFSISCPYLLHGWSDMAKRLDGGRTVKFHFEQPDCRGKLNRCLS